MNYRNLSRKLYLNFSHFYDIALKPVFASDSEATQFGCSIENRTELRHFVRKDGVLELHELHVWSITSDKISLTAHVVLDTKLNGHEVLTAVRQVLFERFHISHTSLQQEDATCLDSEVDCHFHSITLEPNLKHKRHNKHNK